MSNLRLLDPAFGDFDTALRRFFGNSPAEREQPPLQMRIDVAERPEAYTVRADIPGVKKEDIQVHVDGNVVRIEAEVRSEKEQREGDRLLRSERYVGTLARAFSLAQDVDDTRVQARYTDGVLSLELPKKATPEARRITVA
jgi:HSP20 family protein